MIDNIISRICYDTEIANRLFAKIKKFTKQMPCEPRIKVSPYAKFDKYHHKKK